MSTDDGAADVAVFAGGFVVQIVSGHPATGDAHVATLQSATITLTEDAVLAEVGSSTWSWHLADIDEVFHGDDQAWTILAVPGVPDHGVAVGDPDVGRFRRSLDRLLAASAAFGHRGSDTAHEGGDLAMDLDGGAGIAGNSDREGDLEVDFLDTDFADIGFADSGIDLTRASLATDLGVDLEPPFVVSPTAAAPARDSGPPTIELARACERDPFESPAGLAGLEARAISAWFGAHQVLDRVSLVMAPGRVTALIGPSGCGKSTFLRILNRMHELIPSAALAGEVLLDGVDIYDSGRKVTDARREIGMVFQKPNPFPAMSIYDNVVASFQLTGRKMSAPAKDEVVESCLRKAGLWNEVKDRLRQPGGGLSGGQQQRLCIARALAIRPRVLLMDEPCSALDPTSTHRIEQTIAELASEVTIVIVTHNMQQAARVSDACAFFLAEQGTPGAIVEHGPTEAMFHAPRDPRTSDYVNGRFG